MSRKCPICSSTNIVNCSCSRLECKCIDCEAEWHTCIVHNTLVLTRADNSKDIDECTCSDKYLIKVDIENNKPKIITIDTLDYCRGYRDALFNVLPDLLKNINNGLGPYELLPATQEVKMPKRDGSGPPNKARGPKDGSGKGKGNAPGKGRGSGSGGGRGKCK